jgi:hypothetical protein
VSLLRAALLALSCAACSTTPRPEVAPKPLPATGAYVRERRSLGLDAGVTARRRFSASYTEVGEDGTRSERWTCTFSDRVGEVLEQTGPAPWTVVEVQRALDAGACHAPAEDWGLTPKATRFFYFFGTSETTHDVADYRATRQGLAVFLQEGIGVPDGLDASPLEYVLPLRAGVLWHNDPRARRDARFGEKIITNSRRVDERVAEVATPAGTFHDCWAIETYQSANTNDTAWVCEGVGEVRRRLDKFAGSLRFVAETELIGMSGVRR